MLPTMSIKSARACALEKTTRAMAFRSIIVAFASQRYLTLVFLLGVCLDDLPTLVAKTLTGCGHGDGKTEKICVG
jgi:hypothetical protein